MRHTHTHARTRTHTHAHTHTHTYMDSLLTNQNSIQEEIKCRLKAGNSCYYSVQTLLSSRLLSKDLNIEIYKTIILLVVLMVVKHVKHGLLH